MTSLLTSTVAMYFKGKNKAFTCISMRNTSTRVSMCALAAIIVFVFIQFITSGLLDYVSEGLRNIRYYNCEYNLTACQHGTDTARLRVPCTVEAALSALESRSLTSPGTYMLTGMPLVTAFSSNHFEEAHDAVASMQRYIPGHTIHVFDLGLDAWQVNEIKTWCNVKYHHFDFQKYPAHVHRRLYGCAWKPLIFMEMLMRHDALFYFDASIRATCMHVLQHFGEMTSQTGLAVLETTGHSTFAATNAQMYIYLKTTETLLFKIPMLGAGFLAIINTKDVFNGILNWWIRCSLNVECVAPYGSTVHCSFHPEDAYRTWGGCHRYDQSALNILIQDHSSGNVEKYLANKTCAIVNRSPTNENLLQICK